MVDLFCYRIKNRTNGNGKIEQYIDMTDQLKTPPPFDIPLRKNLAYNIYSRRFLEWVLFKSEKAKALLDWSRDTKTPDEHYWLMLDALPEAPDQTGLIKYFGMLRHIVWKGPKRKCGGER